MRQTIVVTDKSVMSDENNDFVAGVVKNFGTPLFVSGLDDEKDFIATQYLSQKEGYDRSFVVNKDYKENPQYSFDEIIHMNLRSKAGDDLRGDMDNPLVLVNARVSLEDVCQKYPTSIVVGYSHGLWETNELVRAWNNGFEAVIGPFEEDLENSLRLGYRPLRRIDFFNGLLKEEDVSSLLLHHHRGRLLNTENNANCRTCDPPRDYAGVQADILGIQTWSELEQQFPDEVFETLYRFDPLLRLVDPRQELPLLGKIGPACGQADRFHLVYHRILQEGRTRATSEWDLREGQTWVHREDDLMEELTWPAVEKYQREYKGLCEKYDVSYPEGDKIN